MRRIAIIIVGCFVTFPSGIYAWEFHYLITRLSLEHTSPLLDREIAVEPLEHFLAAEASGLAVVFHDYYGWLASTGAKRFRVLDFNPKVPNTQTFLRAARLNPKYQFRYLNRSLPGTPFNETLVPYEKQVSLYDRQLSGLTYHFYEVPPGSAKISGREVLSVSSDEPDWGFDNDLWQYEEYGYGKRPYGDEEGLSNFAAFHCEFRHENLLVRTLAPETSEGMAHERLELFSRLAKFALSKNHPYWGLRFAGWALHYVQDISQPFHAKALPFADLRYYLRFALTRDKSKFVQDSTRILVNHHDWYEQSAAVLLENSVIDNDELTAAFRNNQKSIADLRDAQSLFNATSAWSAENAYGIDRTVIEAFGKERTLDPAYTLRSDPGYSGCVSLLTIDPDKRDGLRAQVKRNFEIAGAATRALFALVTGAGT